MALFFRSPVQLGISHFGDQLSGMSVGVKMVRVLARFAFTPLFSAVFGEYELVVFEVVAFVIVEMALGHV